MFFSLQVATTDASHPIAEPDDVTTPSASKLLWTLEASDENQNSKILFAFICHMPRNVRRIGAIYFTYDHVSGDIHGLDGEPPGLPKHVTAHDCIN